MIRICKGLKLHDNIACLDMSHNRIGPVAGKDIGIFLKQTKSLKSLSLAHNRLGETLSPLFIRNSYVFVLGEIIRYPTYTRKESMQSAMKEMCVGLKYNKSLQALDISYNGISGHCLATHLPVAISKHPNLVCLELSGKPKSFFCMLYVFASCDIIV